MTLNQCFSAYAKSLGIENYLSILADKPEIAKNKIDNLTFELLKRYAKLVRDNFLSFNEEGNVQHKSLLEILTDSSPESSIMKNIFNNAIYINGLEFSAKITIEKITKKIDLIKIIDHTKKRKLKNKLEIISYNELIEITKSYHSLTNFLNI